MTARRGFLRTLLGACWTGASVLEQAVFRAAHARAQSAAERPSLFHIEKLADGVFLAAAKPAPQINSNAAIFENSNDVLIVDTHSKPSAVHALAAQIRREVTTKPVRYVVNSHFHWDHSFGNPAVRKAAPGARIIASETTRRLLIDNTMLRVRAYSREAERQIEAFRARLSAAKTDEERRFYKESISASEAFLKEMAAYPAELDLPSLTFDRDFILHDKAHDLHLAFRGRGHTAGDIVVYCPQKKVIATGDLVHGFFPTFADSYPEDWPRTLGAIGEFPYEKVAGGHGPALHGRERVTQNARMIEEMTARVVEARRKGVPAAEFLKLARPGGFAALQRDGLGEFLRANLEQSAFRDPAERGQDPLIPALELALRQIWNALDGLREAKRPYARNAPRKPTAAPV
jgi:glyoxylase-like metal-dependent hydrolase (beta-lactamase superfamily II)